jgi:oligoribonuclease
MSANLVWIDLEMTGLNPETCVVVEIATIVTNSDLGILAEGPERVIHQPESALQSMDDFVTDMHTRSGLIDRIRQSTIPLEEAERETVAFLKDYCEPTKSPLCGNSIWKDRQFIERYMPRLSEFLHYRTIDVSSIKELVRRWYPSRFAPPAKAETHRALDDIRESIEELRYYRREMFVPST